MISIDFQLNGQTVAPGDLERKLTASITETARRAIARRLATFRCPEHLQTPRLVGTGRTSRLRVEACCEQAIERVKRHLKG